MLHSVKYIMALNKMLLSLNPETRRVRLTIEFYLTNNAIFLVMILGRGGGLFKTDKSQLSYLERIAGYEEFVNSR